MTPAWHNEASRLHDTRGQGKAFIALLRGHARADDPEALWWLGNLYELGFRDANGKPVLAADQRRAVDHFRRAVELGHVASMVNLACHLSAGTGVRRNPKKALRLEIRAARLGDSTAAHNAGVSYRLLGNHRAAYRWFRRCAELGDRPWLDLAKSQLFGLGARRDVPAAIRSLKRTEREYYAFESDREEARLLLAYLYLDGVLAKRSHKEGLRWLDRAIAAGSEIARLYRRCVS